MKADNILQKIIVFLFSCLFFLVPLFFTPINSELFEFNKMILTYILTVLIVAAWAGRMILQKRFIIRRTPLDIPLGLFLLSQVLSTIFSIDPHTSLFGYYSRFNGGLLSLISYLLLYWALVSNCEPKNVLKFIKVTLFTGAIVAVYGILEHFGHSFSCLMFEGNFNASCWIQKVQERVFASLGQPNWLAAYLAILIPISLGLMSNVKCQMSNPNAKSKIFKHPFLYFFLTIILYVCLIFTGSRSGFLGLIFGLFAFWLIYFLAYRRELKTRSKFLILNSLFLILPLILFGSPFPQINKVLYYKSWLKQPTVQVETPIEPPPPLEEGGISQSSDIRKVVWKGAIDVFRHYPVFGSGVETFAYIYYQYRPVEHNLLSEWDFLYNKAHNEYLNYLATTGILGLGTYLFFIIAFIIWNIRQFLIFNFQFSINDQNSKFKVTAKKLKFEENKNTDNFELLTLNFALFSGWLTILISNFFGFSVVIVSLYFYLIPALCVVLSKQQVQSTEYPARIFTKFNGASKVQSSNKKQAILFVLLLCTISYVLCTIFNLWRADYFYALGEKFGKQNEYLSSYQNLVYATNLSPNEPVILNELSSSAANLALLAFNQKEATTSSQLLEISLINSDLAVKISPKNLNIYKTRTKVFYTLSAIDPKYLGSAIQTLEKAATLAPTDPKIIYNLGLLYGKSGQAQKAIEYVEKSIELKPNYEEARNALALFYEDLGFKEKAALQLEYLLKIKPSDESIKQRIEKLKH